MMHHVPNEELWEEGEEDEDELSESFLEMDSQQLQRMAEVIKQDQAKRGPVDRPRVQPQDNVRASLRRAHGASPTSLPLGSPELSLAELVVKANPGLTLEQAEKDLNRW